MYDEIIELEELADRNHDKLVKVYITDLLKNYSKTKWEDLTIYERHKLVDWVYNHKQTMNLPIDCICDTAFMYRKSILAGKCDNKQFREILANCWQN